MSGRPVYLVDDDEAVRRALVLLLSTVDVDVKSFPDPESFLAALGKLPPGCLIFDIRMPVISGLKLQERLIAQGIDWPTVVISGHGDIEACRRAFRNGAVDFLSKPVDEQDLIDAIQKAQDMLDHQGDCRFHGRFATHGGKPPRFHRRKARHDIGGGNDAALAAGEQASVELRSPPPALPMRWSGAAC